MREALDESDKWQAAGAWGGVVVGGPVVPIVILVLNWSRRDSLARAHAKVATIVWLVALALYLPMLVRMFSNRFTPDAGFFVVLLLVLVITWGSAIVGAVKAFRSPVAAQSWPAAPLPGWGPPAGYGQPLANETSSGLGPPPGSGPPG